MNIVSSSPQREKQAAHRPTSKNAQDLKRMFNKNVCPIFQIYSLFYPSESQYLVCEGVLAKMGSKIKNFVILPVMQ